MAKDLIVSPAGDRHSSHEWRDADKQPFAVALANRGPMTLAGL
jgi:hypothetical protein